MKSDVRSSLISTHPANTYVAMPKIAWITYENIEIGCFDLQMDQSLDFLRDQNIRVPTTTVKL